MTVQEIHDAIANRDWTVGSSGRKYATVPADNDRAGEFAFRAMRPARQSVEHSHDMRLFGISCKRSENFPDVSLYVFFFGNTPL